MADKKGRTPVMGGDQAQGDTNTQRPATGDWMGEDSTTGDGHPPRDRNQLFQRDWQDRYGAGFLYASLVPGMTRVVQAAGRLHRRPEDRGVIVLVDRRFRWREVAALLPAEWEVSIESDPVPEIRAFFGT